MPSSRQLIASQTLGTAAASVTFSAIPGTYKDLIVRMSTRTDRLNDANMISLFLNQDEVSPTTTSSHTRVESNGATASSSRNSNTSSIAGSWTSTANNTTSTFGSQEIYIPSYAVAQNKPVSIFAFQETNAATPSRSAASAGLWRDTAAVSTIYLYPQGFNFVAGSSFYLYGLAS